MAKFKMLEMVESEPITARLGVGSVSTTPANAYTDKEIGKFVKRSGDSAFVLCAAGDAIEGIIVAVETYTADDFSIGSIQLEDRKRVTLDGLQATPGTGVVAVGDYVVCGTVVALGTALSGPPKVCTATNQPGVTTITTADNTKTNIDIAIAKLVEATRNGINAWRVVSEEGTTAVGQYATIERVNG
jgi:hypothetical protein